MKLLLTSAGITNKSIAKALRELVDGEIRIAFIPTAANVVEGDKDWLIQNFVECEKLGPVDIVDISALDKKTWLPRLQKASVIVVGGGDTVHLINCLRKSGFADELPELLKTRVYVGISAGSIATNPTLATKSDFLYSNKQIEPVGGLGLVSFYIVPHLNSPRFPKARDSIIQKVSKKLPGKLYALDDMSAIAVVDEREVVISEGDWKLYADK